MKAGGGHEISLTSNGQPLRVCLYEEYVAATHVCSAQMSATLRIRPIRRRSL